jgi:predicted nucleic acid-binding protein
LNLAIVDRLPLLRARYERVVIPGAVHEELQALARPGGRQRLGEALREGWIVVEDVPSPEEVATFLNSLDLGQAKALALALQSSADILLMDERKGRVLATQRGQHVNGVLGLLVWAKEHGNIQSVSAEMARLVAEAHFFIHPDLVTLVKTEVGDE